MIWFRYKQLNDTGSNTTLTPWHIAKLDDQGNAPMPGGPWPCECGLMDNEAGIQRFVQRRITAPKRHSTKCLRVHMETE